MPKLEWGTVQTTNWEIVRSSNCAEAKTVDKRELAAAPIQETATKWELVML